MASNTNKPIKTDIVVVGGGASGCTMAALLASHGVDAICVDGEDPAHAVKPEFDGRTTAISFGSRRVMEATGVWGALHEHACPIKDIQITENGSPVLLEFLSRDVGENAFGWIVENRFLRGALFARLAALPHAGHVAPARVQGFEIEQDHIKTRLEDGRMFQSQLVIGADGKNSFTREWMGIATRGRPYHQQAIVCIVGHSNSHNNIAVEDFRDQGPFAILPMMDDKNGNHRSAVVWTERTHKGNSAAKWDDDSFNAAIAERFPDFYGQVKVIGTRARYPLGLSHAHSYIGPRMALIADAAHAIHPIAGQGLNLGLRDVAALCGLIIKAKDGVDDLGSADLLKKYEHQRRIDNMAMVGTTNALNNLFSNDLTPVKWLRRAGLRLVQESPTARRFFMKQAMGASGFLPALIKHGKF